jgi:hypothetical protein
LAGFVVSSTTTSVGVVSSADIRIFIGVVCGQIRKFVNLISSETVLFKVVSSAPAFVFRQSSPIQPRQLQHQKENIHQHFQTLECPLVCFFVRRAT